MKVGAIEKVGRYIIYKEVSQGGRMLIALDILTPTRKFPPQ
jgi:hypothetical protein